MTAFADAWDAVEKAIAWNAASRDTPPLPDNPSQRLVEPDYEQIPGYLRHRHGTRVIEPDAMRGSW